MNWDDLRFLVNLRRFGTMSAAARALNTNVATVSRRLDRFSAITGQPAFVRSQDGWVPLPHVNSLLDLAEEFEHQIASQLNGYEGASAQIIIGAPPFINLTVLIPMLHLLMETSSNAPRITFRNRAMEDGLGDCDVVLRGERPDTGRIIARRVGYVSFDLYAPPGWNGTDWAGLIEGYDETRIMCLAFAHFGFPPVVRVEHLEHLAGIMRELKLAGPLPVQMAKRHPELEPVDGTDLPVRGDAWCCYHASRKGDPALSRVLEWISEAFRRLPDHAAH